MSSDYLLSRSIDDVRDASVFLLVRWLLLPILEREGLQRYNKCLRYSQFYQRTNNLHERMETARESQHNTVNISVTTSCVESFRARKQIFQKLHTLYIFEKQLSFVKSQTKTLSFHCRPYFLTLSTGGFFPRNILIILNERALEPSFDAAGQ